MFTALAVRILIGEEHQHSRHDSLAVLVCDNCLKWLLKIVLHSLLRRCRIKLDKVVILIVLDIRMPLTQLKG